MTAEFTLSLNEPATDDRATAHFLDFRAAVANGDFAGRTQFPLARRDLDTFIADVAALRQSGRDSALLLGGWESETRLRLHIAPDGLSGRFVTTVRIAITGLREERWHRLETEFVCAPDALSVFLIELKRLVDQGAEGHARLAGDPEAVAALG